jgi:hypothetical protein
VISTEDRSQSGVLSYFYTLIFIRRLGIFLIAGVAGDIFFAGRIYQPKSNYDWMNKISLYQMLLMNCVLLLQHYALEMEGSTSGKNILLISGREILFQASGGIRYSSEFDE